MPPEVVVDNSKCFLSRKIEALRLVADGKVEVDVRPEVFIDHHADAEADGWLNVLKQGDVPRRIVSGGGIHKNHPPDDI